MKKISDYIEPAKKHVKDVQANVDHYIDRLTYLKKLKESDLGQWLYNHADHGINSETVTELENMVNEYPGLEFSFDGDEFIIRVTDACMYYHGDSESINFDIDDDIKMVAIDSLGSALKGLEWVKANLIKIENLAATKDFLTKEDVLDWIEGKPDNAGIYDRMFRHAGIDLGILEDSVYPRLKEKLYTDGARFVKANALTIRKAKGNWVEVKVMTIDDIVN